MPDLSIAIPTFNRASYLLEALSAIQDDADGLADSIEIVISDNASKDNTEEVARAFEKLNVRYDRNVRNLGAIENVFLVCKHCTGKYILLLSDDDLICPGSISRLIEHIRRMPQIGVIASPLEVFEDGLPNRLIGKTRFPGGKSDILLQKGAHAVSNLFLRTTSLSGLVIRRDLLDIAGAKKHAQSLYPQMYLVGYAAKKADALYLAQPLVKVRSNAVKYWSYEKDLMAKAVLEILKDLTINEPWGRKVRKVQIRKRIWASYGPLYTARNTSLKFFFRLIRGLASVPEYRHSGVFWLMAFGFAVLSNKGVDVLRKIWKGPVIDSVRA